MQRKNTALIAARFCNCILQGILWSKSSDRQGQSHPCKSEQFSQHAEKYFWFTTLTFRLSLKRYRFALSCVSLVSVVRQGNSPVCAGICFLRRRFCAEGSQIILCCPEIS